MSAFQDAGRPDDKKATLFISNLSKMAMVKVDGEKVIPDFHIAFEATSWFVEMLPGRHHIDAKWQGVLPQKSTWDLWPRNAILSGDFVAENGKNYFLRVDITGNESVFVLHGADIVELPPGYNLANSKDGARMISEVVNKCQPVANLHISND
jgi:hypothetical protein